MDDLDELMQRVIGAAIEVHRFFGAGFAEITYHRAMMIELDRLSIKYRSEVPIELVYKDIPVGEGYIDLLVEERLVIELKACEANPKRFKRQVVAYLKAIDLQRGLVINFEVDVLKEGLGRVSV